MDIEAILSEPSEADRQALAKLAGFEASGLVREMPVDLLGRRLITHVDVRLTLDRHIVQLELVPRGRNGTFPRIPPRRYQLTAVP